MGTCVDPGPNLAPCACGVSLLSAGGYTVYTAHVVVVTGCNLRWLCFSIRQQTRILQLHSSNATCTVWWSSVVTVLVIVHVLQCIVKNRYTSYVTVIVQPWGKTSKQSLC